MNQASPQDPKTPRGGWEYHATLIPKAAKKPIRIWMEVGEKDLHFDDPEQTWHNWPLANNRMAAVLKKKGYDYKYVFAMDAHHVDNGVVRQTLAVGAGMAVAGLSQELTSLGLAPAHHGAIRKPPWSESIFLAHHAVMSGTVSMVTTTLAATSTVAKGAAAA